MKISSSFARSLLTFTFAAALAALPAVLRAEDAPKGPPPEGRRPNMHERLDRMAEELGLTADQKTKIGDLMKQEGEELKALRGDESTPKEQKKEKAEAIRKKYLEQRQALMTPEQREKAAKMRERGEKLRERREERREERAGKTGDK